MINTFVPVVRFMHFRSLVDSLLQRFHVDVVGIESPAYGGGPFSERHFGLMMYSLESVFKHRKDCVLFDPATVKSLATGNGAADKSDMQRHVQLDRMSPEQVQSDEADAFFMGKFACRFAEMRAGIVKPEDLTERERHVFLERKTKRKGAKAAWRNPVKKTAIVFRENSRFFSFSQIPQGSVELPKKSEIPGELLEWLERSDGQL